LSGRAGLRLPEHGLAAVLSLAIFAPVLRPGYVLSYDLVATPHLPFTAATLGWGDGLPRAVPQDAVVAVLTTVLPGWLVEVVALVATVWLAVAGAARLAPSERLLVRLVAGAAYGWNGFVAERLVIGHVGLLLAYGALPWLIRAALEARKGKSAAPVVGWAALSSLTPTGGLIAAVAAAVVLGWPRWRWALAVAALNAPWIVAGAVATAGAGSDPSGVAAFAARAENWSGTLGALLGLGGIWNADVVPASRTSVLAPLFTLLVLLVAAAGWRFLEARRSLTVLGLGALLVAALSALPGGQSVLRALIDAVPGAGLLRDAQKFLPPFALLLSLCFALGVEQLMVIAPRKLAAGAAIAALLFPVLVLPDLAWGADGRLASSHYPADWDAVERKLGPGELVTLPFSSFRQYPWNDDRTQLDPAARYFPVDVVVEDALPVGEHVVAGESRRADDVRQALQAGYSLTSLGIRWILVERRTPGQVPSTALAGFKRVWAGPDLVLYENPSAGRSESSGARVAAVLAGYGIAIGVLAGSLVAFRRRAWPDSQDASER
jgi:hypothetical protein